MIAVSIPSFASHCMSTTEEILLSSTYNAYENLHSVPYLEKKIFCTNCLTKFTYIKNVTIHQLDRTVVIML